LHSTVGFLPIFGATQTTGLSVFTAGLVLTVMVIPIIAALSRDLFLTVPRELKEGRRGARSHALGGDPRRGWLPTTVSGVGRGDRCSGWVAPLGEAIAVAQVIGDGKQDPPVAVCSGNHARQQDRGRLPEHAQQAALRIAVLSGADPARDRRHHQPDRTGDRESIRRHATGH